MATQTKMTPEQIAANSQRVFMPAQQGTYQQAKSTPDTYASTVANETYKGNVNQGNAMYGYTPGTLSDQQAKVDAMAPGTAKDQAQANLSQLSSQMTGAYSQANQAYAQQQGQTPTQNQPSPTYLNPMATGADTGVAGHQSYTQWKVANPNGSYKDWQATLPASSNGTALGGSITAQTEAAKSLAATIGQPDANGNYSPEQQKAIDSVNQFNQNFGKAMNMNLGASQNQANQNIAASTNVPTTPTVNPAQAGNAPADQSGQASQMNVPSATPSATGNQTSTGDTISSTGTNVSDIASYLHSANTPGIFDGTDSHNAYAAMMEGISNITQRYMAGNIPIPKDVQDLSDRLMSLEGTYADMTQAGQDAIKANLVQANDAAQVLENATLESMKNEEAIKESMAQGDIDMKRQQNARFAGYLKGALMGAGFNTASAAIDSIQYQSEVHSWELEKMEQGKTLLTNTYLTNANQIMAQFASQAITRNTNAMQQVNDLQKALMTNITDIEKQRTTSITAARKDTLTAVVDMYGKQAQILNYAKQDDQFAKTYSQNQLKINLQTAMLANTLKNQSFTQFSILNTAHNQWPNDPQITAAWQSQMNTVSGGIQGMGTPAVRNNNPGNLRAGGATDSGGFTIFPDMQTGFNAMVSDLKAKQTGNSSTGINGSSTLLDMISVYAPKSDGNDPVAYAKVVSQKLGVTPDTKIGTLDTNQLALAMAQHEDPNAYAMISGQTAQQSGQWNVNNPSRPTDPYAPVNFNGTQLGINQATVWNQALNMATLGKPSASFKKTGEGQQAINAITSKSNALVTAAGIQPDQLQSEFKSSSAANKSQYNYFTTVDRSLNSAANNTKTILDIFSKYNINPTDATWVNKNLNSVTQAIGNQEDIKAYKTAMTELGNDYGQVFSRGSDQATVNANQQAQAIFDGNVKLSDMGKTFDTLQKLGEGIKASSLKELQNIGNGEGLPNLQKWYSYLGQNSGGQAGGGTSSGTYGESDLTAYMTQYGLDRNGAISALQKQGFTLK